MDEEWCSLHSNFVLLCTKFLLCLGDLSFYFMRPKYQHDKVLANFKENLFLMNTAVEDSCLLGKNAAFVCRWFPLFQKVMLP